MCDLHNTIFNLFLNIMMMELYMFSSYMENRIIIKFDYALIVTRNHHWFHAFDNIQLYQQSLQPNTLFGIT